jgi:DNA-binding NtrC family response regulator
MRRAQNAQSNAPPPLSPAARPPRSIFTPLPHHDDWCRVAIGIIKIIIISGVQDFNYAKTALSVNAEGYILKPVKIPELKEVITKVVNGINLEREKKFELENLQDQLVGTCLSSGKNLCATGYLASIKARLK